MHVVVKGKSKIMRLSLQQQRSQWAHGAADGRTRDNTQQASTYNSRVTMLAALSL